MSVPIQPPSSPLTLLRPEGPSSAHVGTLGPGPATPNGDTDSTRTSSFVDQLEQLMTSVDATQKQAEAASSAFEQGRSDDIHGTMLALSRADITFRLAASVRNRVVEAYREVMRMGG